MTSIMGDDAYLDKERNIYNYLENTLRMYRILAKLTKRKESIVKKTKKTVLVLLAKEYNLIKRVWNRKQIKAEKIRILIEIEKLGESIGLVIKRQKRFLIKDFKIESDEKNLIIQVEHLPMFSSANQNEKELIEELVYKQQENIVKLIDTLVNYSNSLRHQEEVVKMFETEAKTQEELKKKVDEFTTKMIEFCYWEERAINLSIKLTKALIVESKRIIMENKEIEKRFNPHDLVELRKDIGEELKREKDKAWKIEQYLRKQRDLRSPNVARSLIAIHITKYFPTDGKLRPTGQYDIEYLNKKLRFPRQTIHFALNGPVGEHMMGAAWHLMRYAILIPVERFLDRIINISPQDSFIVGELTIPPGSEIIVKSPDKPLEYYQRLVPQANIIFINSTDDMYSTIQNRIITRGYQVMTIGMWGWGGVDYKAMGMSDMSGETNWQRFAEDMGKKLNKELGPHNSTFWSHMEDLVKLAYDNMYDKGHEEDIDVIKKEIPEALLKLVRRARNFTAPEEKEAYYSIIRLLKKVYKEVKEKYPNHWRLFRNVA
ncbi:MAG: hypothetical protein ABIJ08_04345 [Nanoarchaeota archaeon]